MAMTFKPKSEKEIKEANLAPEAEYNFEVLDSADLISKKSGNPMIGVKLGIYNGEAIRWHVDDYLLEAMPAKLRHFCDSTGLLAKYESGSLCAADCKGRAGRCKLGIEKDKSGTYPDKNKVKDYLCRAAKPLATAEPAKAQPGESDDIPF